MLYILAADGQAPLAKFESRPVGLPSSQHHEPHNACSIRAGAGGDSSMSALEAWKQRVAAHREQSYKIRSALGVTGQDRWEPFSSFFKADPRRTDDVEVNRLAQEVTPATTLLDV